MQPMITENREKIAELCRTHRVRCLSVFGSAVRNDFDPERSDVDVLVEFDSIDGGYAKNYFSLLFSFDQLLGREVDLVIDGAIRNPYLRNSSSQTRSPFMQRELKRSLWDMLAGGAEILRFFYRVSLANYRESELLRPASLEQVRTILAVLPT